MTLGQGVRGRGVRSLADELGASPELAGSPTICHVGQQAEHT
jgi:hypothetical protein